MDVAQLELERTASFLYEVVLRDYLFWLNCVHSAFVIHGLKKSIDARKRPVASFILSFISCYISGIVVNALCALPLLGGMKNNELNGAIVILWWTINFPLAGVWDFLFTNKLTVLLLLSAKELLRCRKLYMAAEKGAASYDSHILLSLVVGTCGACGGGFLKQGLNLARLNRIGNADMSFSSAAKLSAFFTMFYVLERLDALAFIGGSGVTRAQIVLVQTLFMTLQQTAAKWGYHFDPFQLPERILCEIFITMGRDLETDQTKKTN